jgi:pilus assembly protein CpaE
VFRSIIISPDEELGSKLAAALEATGAVSVSKNVNGYPAAVDLVRTLRAHAADILFLSFETVDKALEVVRVLEAEASHVPVVGFHREMDPHVLRESMRAGVREFLAEPFERAALKETLSQVKTLLEKRPAVYTSTEQIFTFLPSKAGAGTSTIAANVSAALARKPENRVLLSDFDMNSGMLRFMMNLKNEYSVCDAMEFSLEMDENMWPQLVTNVDGMDVLHAGRINPNLRIESQQIRNLVAFLRRHYSVLCFDLSGNLEKYSIELMQESKRILLVCTPEVPSLHLAREKVQFLKQLDLDSRISVVLNRVSKKPLFTTKQVEELLGLPVIREFPNDYQTINQCVTAGKLVPKVSELGKAFTEFGDVLTIGPQAAAKRPPAGRKFLQFVSTAVSTPATGRE